MSSPSPMDPPTARRRARHLLPLLLVAVAAAVSLLGMPAAGAAPGAVGHINHTAGTPEEVACYQNKCHFNASGWAYNPRTAPTQAVVLHFYDVHGTLVHTSAQYLADEYNINSPTKWRYYSWGYDVTEPITWGSIGQWQDMCAFAHDRGESGGYVSIGCQTIRQYR